ncbi:DUF535 family protein [Mesorhizobium sp. SP-1A]|uniref:DUF535 family protein n=1 Tax=Mesorhizobium sp. SP-1A TaxID=3077840 RepID=UPI0028F711F2|nr:DUF535 family protein [Mesorhizobium sp. SP-1A]
MEKVDSAPAAEAQPAKTLPHGSALWKRLDDSWRTAKWAALRWLNRREIAAVKSAFAEQPLARILAKYPDIPLKPVRPYLLSGLKRRDRPAAVIRHYAAAARILTAEALVESHTTGVRLLSLPTQAGEITVDLAGQGPLYREAEWRLVLNVDRRPVVEMGLAIVEPRLVQFGGSGEVFWIGVLKTVLAGKHGLEDSRALTKALEGLRPKALLLLVAQALAGAFNLSGIFAASNKGHVFAGDYSLRRRIKADYDSFWTESGGNRVSPAVFALPLVKTQRDPCEYKPNKRAQIRRRQMLEQEIEKQVREAVAPLLA